MTIRLSDRFSYKRLLRFTCPAIAMMLFTSIYSVVDGYFVSNFAGKSALAAMTLIVPLLGMLGAIGFMLGTGGAAIVGKLLGEGRAAEAQRSFSLFVYVALGGGALLALAGEAVIGPLARLLGAEGELLAGSLVYGRICLLSLPFFMLQFLFQTFFVTAEKPKLGLAVTVAAGCTNMLLDALLVALLGWGLTGAALATALSECIGGGLPLLYFARKNTSLLRLTRPGFSARMLGRACGNGASEFLNNIAFSYLIVLYNYQLLRLAGENGVAAFGILLYVSFVFSTIFAGYAIGVAPLFSYNFGAGRRDELKNLCAKSLVLNAGAGLFVALFCAWAAGPVARAFTGYDPALCQLSTRAIRLFAPAFLLLWANVFASSLFPALNNGRVSALIALLRMFVFGTLSLVIMPLLFGLDGLWCAWTMAELASLAVSLSCFLHLRGRYGYA